MNNAISLKEFGYNFLGPICSEYFHHLKDNILNEHYDFVGFLAREGFLFDKIYQSLANENAMPDVRRQYVLASRSFLFRISIADPYTWQWSLSHGFVGSLQMLFVARFGFTVTQLSNIFSESELESEWVLPDQIAELTTLLMPRLNQFENQVGPTRDTYIKYLTEIGLATSQHLLLLDIGYSGTIQKLLVRLLEKDISALYFITTHSGTHTIEKKNAVMNYVFKDDVRMGEGYKMLDRSMFLEALLTSPKGQFVDIRMKAGESGFDFYYSRNAYTQQNFHALNCVFEGATQAVLENFKHEVRYSTTEIEELYQGYSAKRNMLPSSAWALFDLDDAISGNGNIHPLTFFGL